ncbi:MAG: hypothetical protein FWF37_01075 [Chloroflexi bacterium]|nr:hypothetical protein [Chloroflexota bacterium]
MSKDLGKIEKPPISKYQDKRKLYAVPLLLSSDKAPQEFKDMAKEYWQQVEKQLENLENSIGCVNHIYHEAVSNETDALDSLKKLSSGTYPIIEKAINTGAKLEALEDRELILATTDWERFMMIGIASQAVAKIASDAYVQNTKERFIYMSQKINGTLMPSQAAVLFLREYEQLHLDSDIEVFSVAPPVLNDINRWLREQADRPYHEVEQPTTPDAKTTKESHKKSNRKNKEAS